MLTVTVAVVVKGFDGGTLIEVLDADTVIQVADDDAADEAALLHARLDSMLTALHRRSLDRAQELQSALERMPDA